MIDGTISGNTASSSYAYGGGVYVTTGGGTFTKAPVTGGSTSGTIYGSNAGDTLKNTAKDGAAVYYGSYSNPVKYRNTTVGETVNLYSADNDNWMD